MASGLAAVRRRFRRIGVLSPVVGRNMGKTFNTSTDSLPLSAESKKYYRDLFKKLLLRLLFTYVTPFLISILYIQFQYSHLLEEGAILHMKSIAENQAKTLDLYLRERVVNLMNLIDDPGIQNPPSPEKMLENLGRLKRESPAFIDIGFFNYKGVQAEYCGPISTLEQKDYSGEKWYRDLQDRKDRYIITDIYLGLRKKPHFTIGVKRLMGDRTIVMRATLDPEKIYDYMLSLEGAKDVYIAAVNHEGSYQLVTPHVGMVLGKSGVIPPETPYLGIQDFELDGTNVRYAYAWLQNAPWAVVIRRLPGGSSININLQMLVIGALFLLVISGIIIVNTRRLVRVEKEKDLARSQLEHAAKLASVGELAGGIAHEINNPLAIIASEAGLMSDYMEIKKEGYAGCDGMKEHLVNITDAVYRCRDITTKLLSFVRRNVFNLADHDIHSLIDDIISGFLEREMAVSGIRIERSYTTVPSIRIDGNQFKQVMLNIVNNAVDAITPPGIITVSTRRDEKWVRVSVTDTGKGMTEEQMQRIFLPFYTTKKVGKGTGLGLSVSYAIIKNLGGKISVDSAEGDGSTFTIFLPIT